MESFQEAGHQIELLVEMAVWTILLRVFLHGMTAVPVANWYAKRLQSAAADAPELKKVAEIKTHRRRMAGGDSETI